MALETFELLAQSRRTCLVAPAGCGKTEEIARAVAASEDGRQLILTHTHAGVSSLRKRLKALRVPGNKYHVDTIAGWALRYAASFPALSGLIDVTPTGAAWNAVYSAAGELLQRSAVRKVVEASYAGVYVDEYQDCTIIQHRLILRLADILPCRVLGDPLQGIFGFKDPLVSWETDVYPAFQRLPDLTTPWRWKNSNQKLGTWLTTARQHLLASRPVNCMAPGLTWKPKAPQNQRAACQGCAKPKGGSAVAIHMWPNDCHAFASTLGGLYTSMEEIECKDLLKWSRAIEEAHGPVRAATVIEFAQQCMTQVATELKPAHDRFAEGRLPEVARYRTNLDVIQALMDVACEDTLAPILPALGKMAGVKGAVLYRRELWQEMPRAIRAFLSGKYDSLRDAAWHVRDRARQTGRQPDHRTVSRTLLVKGLEFEHAIVLDADELDRRNLYVALTRGARSLTVLSANPILCPRR